MGGGGNGWPGSQVPGAGGDAGVGERGGEQVEVWNLRTREWDCHHQQQQQQQQQSKTSTAFCFHFERCNPHFLFSRVTALHCSSSAGRLDTSELLVASSAHVNAKDDKCGARVPPTFLKQFSFCFCCESGNPRLFPASALHSIACVLQS